MAAEVNTGMDKGAMKRMLAQSKKEPVNCAIAGGKDPAFALLMLDKVKSGKALLKDLQKEFPDAKTPTFGMASVNPEVDPTLVEFRLNKAVSGMSRKLAKTLKGTGFSKVSLMLEDGTPLESGGDEDEAAGAAPAAAAGGGASPPAPAAAPEPVAAPPPPPPQAAASQAPAPPPAPQAAAAPGGQPDASAITARVTGLVQQMMPVIAADPSRLDSLKQLAGQAQTALKSGNLGAASQAADALQQALAAPAAPAAPATNGAAPPAAAAANGAAPTSGTAPPPATTAAVQKSRLAWVATRKKIENDIAMLKSEIMAVCDGQDIEAALEAGFKSKVEPVLQKLDTSLSEKLDEVSSAVDPNERNKLVAEAKQIMKGYQSFVTSDPIIKHLDSNPFVPLAISKTLNATLTTLASAVR